MLILVRCKFCDFPSGTFVKYCLKYHIKVYYGDFLDLDDLDLLLSLAKSLESRGLFDDSVSVCKQVLVLDPHNVFAGDCLKRYWGVRVFILLGSMLVLLVFLGALMGSISLAVVVKVIYLFGVLKLVM